MLMVLKVSPTCDASVMSLRWNECILLSHEPTGKRFPREDLLCDRGTVMSLIKQ